MKTNLILKLYGIISIKEIRFYSNDVNLTREYPFAFEFDSAERTFAVACETGTEKVKFIFMREKYFIFKILQLLMISIWRFIQDCWLTALSVARDAAITKKSAYRMQHKELDINSIESAVEMFLKQDMVFSSLLQEDRPLVSTTKFVLTFICTNNI